MEDDRVARAAQRIVRQYHLEQSDRSEDSAAHETAAATGGNPESVHALRLALDDMAVRIEHMQRLMVNREALFMAALERVERNQAKADGRLDALSAEVARIDSQPAIDRASAAEDQRSATIVLMEEFGGVMALGRTLLDEVRAIHAATAGTDAGDRDADDRTFTG